jgi:hypothetical protein
MDDVAIRCELWKSAMMIGMTDSRNINLIIINDIKSSGNINLIIINDIKSSEK